MPTDCRLGFQSEVEGKQISKVSAEKYSTTSKLGLRETMNRCYLCPSTPPYIGGGVEGFIIHKLQSPGGFLTRPARLQVIFPNTTLAFLNNNLGFRFFLSFGSWAFSKPRVPSSAGPLGMPMSVAPEIFLESRVRENIQLYIRLIALNFITYLCMRNYILCRDNGSWGQFI